MGQKERASSSLRMRRSLFVVGMFVVVAHTVWMVDGFSPPSSQQSQRLPSSSQHQNQRTVTILAPHRSSTNRFLQSQTDDNAESSGSSSPSNSQKLRQEADQLRAKAQQLRQEVSSSTTTLISSSTQETSTSATVSRTSSPWHVVLSDTDDYDNVGAGYRLHIDIGREDGTWMDRRWGASGRRISLTLDVLFTRDEVVEKNDASTTSTDMVLDNIAGSSSPTMILQTATRARLRDGFDEMKCGSGISNSDGKKNAYYRIDYNENAKQRVASSDTVRFYIPVAGTKSDQNYGDVDIPQGNLYFSVPCFGGSVQQLSTKEGVVTVRQVGWNTGWRREESRIVGVFQAKPIVEAKRKDGF